MVFVILIFYIKLKLYSSYVKFYLILTSHILLQENHEIETNFR